MSGELQNAVSEGSITAQGDYFLIIASQLYADSYGKITSILVNSKPMDMIASSGNTMQAVYCSGKAGDVITFTRSTEYGALMYSIFYQN